MSKSSILGFQQMGQQVEQANQSSHQHYRGQNVAPPVAGDSARGITTSLGAVWMTPPGNTPRVGMGGGNAPVGAPGRTSSP